MRITALTELLNTETKKIDSAKKIESASKSKTVPADKTEFSSKAQRLNDTKAQIDIVNSKIASEPDIRPEKIAEVQEKIQNGFYNSDDFVDKLATKLLDEFGIKQTS
jgi:flagellar biosynthesis anti-sigma factor FlgM